MRSVMVAAVLALFAFSTAVASTDGPRHRSQWHTKHTRAASPSIVPSESLKPDVDADPADDDRPADAPSQPPSGTFPQPKEAFHPRDRAENTRRVTHDPYLDMHHRATRGRPAMQHSDFKVHTGAHRVEKQWTEEDFAAHKVIPINFDRLEQDYRHHQMQLILVHSTDPRECDPTICHQAMTDFTDSCHFIATHEAGMDPDVRRLHFASLDLSKQLDGNMTAVRRRLRSLNPHDAWRLPLVMLVNGRETGYKQHVKVWHPRHKFYRADVEHVLMRLIHGHITPFHNEGDLMSQIFDTHNDGVTIAMFFNDAYHRMGYFPHRDDPLEIHQGFFDVSRDNYLDVHFVIFEPPRGSQESGAEALWTGDVQKLYDTYNPHRADLVAFVVQEGTDEPADDFVAEFFNFTQGVESEHDEEWLHFSNLKRLRTFVERAKAHRHTKSQRKFLNIKERIEVNHHPDRVGKEAFCSPAHRIEPGDNFTATVVGWSVETHEAFLTWDDPRELVAGDAIAHLPPYMHDFAVGWCDGSTYSVHMPAHHGFHAEVYDVTIHAVSKRVNHPDPAQRPGFLADDSVHVLARHDILSHPDLATIDLHPVDQFHDGDM